MFSLVNLVSFLYQGNENILPVNFKQRSNVSVTSYTSVSYNFNAVYVLLRIIIVLHLVLLFTREMAAEYSLQ